MQQTRLQCNRVWLQTCTCTLRHLHSQHLHAQTLALSALALSALACSDTCTLRHLHSQHLHAQHLHAQTLVRSALSRSDICTLRHLHSQHLHAQTLALPRVMSLAVFFILFYLLIIFCLNLSTFYNSSQVVKTRKKKKNVTCNRCLHFLLHTVSCKSSVGEKY